MGRRQILRAAEEGLGTALKQGVENWATKAGIPFLESLGESGKVLAQLAKNKLAGREFVGSNLRKAVREVFEPFDQNGQSHVEDLWAGKISMSAARTPEHQKAAQRLRQVEFGTTTMLNQAQIKGRDGQPLAMRADGPSFYNDNALRESNSDLRQFAIRELMMQYGLSNDKAGLETAASMLDEVLSLHRKRDGYKWIYGNPIPLSTGRAIPLHRWEKWGESVAEVWSDYEHFGPNMINLVGGIEAILKERGRVSADNAANFFDIFLKIPDSAPYREAVRIPKDSGYKITGQVEGRLRKLSGYVFTDLVAIPQSTQLLVNLPLKIGMGKSLQAIGESLTDFNGVRDWVMRTGALEESLRFELEEQLRGGKTIIEKLFHQPGFSAMLKWQGVVAAHGGRLAAEEAVTRLAQNAGDSSAKQILFELGLDPVSIAARGHLLPHEVAKAAYTAADDVLFFRSSASMKAPMMWESTPFGRVVNMYKHFAHAQAGFLYQAYKKAFERGDAVELGRLLGLTAVLFPVFGEFMRTANDMVTGKSFEDDQRKNNYDIQFTDNEAFNRYLNNFAYAGGFGLIYQVLRTSKGRFLDFFAGPFPSIAADLGFDIGAAILTDEVTWRTPTRKIAKRFPVIGDHIARQIPEDDYSKKKSSHPRSTQRKRGR